MTKKSLLSLLKNTISIWFKNGFEMFVKGRVVDVEPMEPSIPEMKSSSPRNLSPVDVVMKWVDKHGLGLEMAVAGAFRKKLPAGYFMSSVDHGRGYKDFDPESETVKLRETDVVVRYTKITSRNVWLSVWIIVECKSSKDSPWILYYDAAQPTGFRQDSFGSLWKSKFSNDLDPNSVRGSGSSGLLSGNGMASCYSVNTATERNGKGSQRNFSREAMQEVLSAVDGVREDANVDEHSSQFHIFIPVVVTSAPMCTITLLMDGEFKIEECQRGLYKGRLDSSNDNSQGIWIVGENDIERFVSEIIDDIQNLDYEVW